MAWVAVGSVGLALGLAASEEAVRSVISKAARGRDEGGDGEEAVVGEGAALGDDGLEDHAVAESELVPAACRVDGVKQRERILAITLSLNARHALRWGYRTGAEKIFEHGAAAVQEGVEGRSYTRSVARIDVRA